MYQVLKRILIISSIVLLAICLCIVSMVFTYYHSLPDCIGEASSRKSLPIPPFLLKINSFDVVVTGKKRLHIGQTFTYDGDGPWLGSATLLFVDSDNAVFLLEYYDDGKSNQCIWHAPKSDFNH